MSKSTLDRVIEDNARVEAVERVPLGDVVAELERIHRCLTVLIRDRPKSTSNVFTSELVHLREQLLREITRLK
jgi:Ni,Fe-hydrogenase III large subunit